MSSTLKQYENKTLLKVDGGSGVAFEEARIITGSRMVVTLYVGSISAGATVTLDIANTFSQDVPYESIGTLQLTTTGRRHNVYSDFHELFKFTVTVVGGTADYQVAISIFDNASTTRIENAQIAVELTDQEDSVEIGDGLGVIVRNIYGEASSVASSATTTIVSFTVMASTVFYLQRVECSGDNIATYRILVDGDKIASKNTWFNGPMAETFEFNSSPKNGLKLTAGQVIEVEVENFRPSIADFSGRIYGIQKAA